MPISLSKTQSNQIPHRTPQVGLQIALIKFIVHFKLIQFLILHMSSLVSGTRNFLKRYKQFLTEAGVINDENLEILPTRVPIATNFENQQHKQPPAVKASKQSTTQKVQVVEKIVSKKSKKIYKLAIKQQQKASNLCPSSISQQVESCEKPQGSTAIISQEEKQSPSVADSPLPTIITFNVEQKKEEPQSPKLLPDYLIPLCLNKNQNTMYGYFGHSTVLTNRPIIEGSYYIQVKIIKDARNKNNLKQVELFTLDETKIHELQSHVRIGIAPANYKLLTPLGGENSYAYKGIDGTIVHDKHILAETGCNFQIGDIVGMQLHMQPPVPVVKQSNQMVNQGSYLVFFKNGQKVFEIRNLKQQYYVFGASLFNWANVEFNQGPDFLHPPLHEQQVQPYCQIYGEKILYRDIKF